MGPPDTRRSGVQALEHVLDYVSEEHNVLVWNAESGSPRWLRAINWHAVFLGPTFLASRYGKRFLLYRALFRWLSDLSSIKVALPQDEYDSPAILDSWMQEWGIDHIVSTFPERAGLLYPKSCSSGVAVSRGYTGVVTRDLENRHFSRGDLESRPLDVVYRARSASARFGKLGQMKSQLGQRFADAAGMTHSLRLDLSGEASATIHGDAWIDFLGSSVATLTLPSGSSLIDFDGRVRKCLQKKRIRGIGSLTPGQHCLEMASDYGPFEALAPRHIEAALLGTVQIGVVGDYSGVLLAGEHYLALEPDFSNIQEVLTALRDFDKLEAIRASALERVMSIPRLQAGVLARDLVGLVLAHADETGLVGGNSGFSRVTIERAGRREERLWATRAILSKNRRQSAARRKKEGFSTTA